MLLEWTMDDEDQQHLEEMLRTYKRRLRVLEQQEASAGPRTPPEVRTEIDDVRTQISNITSKLSNLITKKAIDTVSRSSNSSLVIVNEDNIDFTHTGGHLGLPQSFACALNFYIDNSGDRPISLQSFSCRVGINDIFDEFLIKRIGTIFSASKLMKGSLSANKYSYQFVDRDVINLPLMIRNGVMLPLTLFIQIDVNEYRVDDLFEIYNWIMKLNIVLTYKIFEQGCTKEEVMNISVDCKQLRKIVAEVTSRYRAEQKKNPNR